MRRFLVGAGLALLIGGWGCTRYADAEMRAVTAGNDGVTVWDERMRPAHLEGCRGGVEYRTVIVEHEGLDGRGAHVDSQERGGPGRHLTREVRSRRGPAPRRVALEGRRLDANGVLDSGR